MRHIQIVLFEGAEDQDFTGPYEVFSAAGHISPGAFAATYVTLDGPRTVTTSYGTRVEVESGWSPDSADVLVVPGGGWHPKRPGQPGVTAEIERGDLPKALRSARQREGLTIAAVCTGAMLLSAAGITDGRPCTTHHGAKAELVKEGGVVKDARVVDDGDLVTSGGVTSGLDLALWLVRREAGADLAVKLEALLEYERRGTVWRA
ncbi:DJ-1/PfpI family protein [Streptomyces albireticuli]|uniref:AraC family transcriptional regulator n=1 Tax=Streptomyces albireticuli TaxID=1940 RepID=A0A2A2D3M4_9ACTN|nr:DJ-1/PfpI family protein [Streptomyces albireticuli]MCD9195141.1 DJ-1/PfpI family protein [Streptomyces albireticuli]PAU47043.1 AraC family transcriptional regulator [Streptomyces albireticuli]